MRTKKRCLFLLLMISLILAISQVYAVTFSDINGHWAESVVKRMVDMGVLNGFEDGTFKPNEPVTREQFAKILVETFKLKETTGSKFEDVEDNRWSKEYIDIASAYMRVTTKYFNPDEECKRRDVALAISEVLELYVQIEEPNLDLLKQFSDYDKIIGLPDKYSESIARIVESGIMQGKGGYFDPNGRLTRGEVSQLLFNVYERKVTGDLDNDGNITIGDVDGNGKVNSEDIKIITAYIEGNRSDITIAGDVNKNGIIDLFDIWLIENNISNKIELPHVNCNSYSKTYSNITSTKHDCTEICECGKIKIVKQRETHKNSVSSYTCYWTNPYTHCYYERCSCGIELVNREENHTIVNEKCIKCSFDVNFVDRNQDGIANDHDVWLMKNDPNSWGHIGCQEHKKEYMEIKSIVHKYAEVCECGKTRTDLKTEPHVFKDGKCECGKLEHAEKVIKNHEFKNGICECGLLAVNGEEYVIAEEYSYKNRKKTDLTSSDFVEIKIGYADFENYQNGEIIITPVPDKIKEDQFGNKYIQYYLEGLKPNETFDINIKKVMVCGTFKDEIPSNSNTKISEDLKIYLQPQEMIDSDYEGIKLKANELTKNKTSDYEKAKAIFEYININAVSDLTAEYANKGSISALQTMRGTTEEFSTLFVAMCRVVNIPSRVIEGYSVEGKELINIVWAEIYLEDFGWVPVNPSIMYKVGNTRMPYFDAFCKIKSGDYIATGIYYYEMSKRMYTMGLDETKMNINLK